MKTLQQSTLSLQQIEKETHLEYTLTTEAHAHFYVLEMLADANLSEQESLESELIRSRKRYLNARAQLSDLNADRLERVEMELAQQKLAMESASVVYH